MSMTESECIESLNGIYPEWCSEKEEYEMAQVAIHALEEIQQYRAIGTVSDFRELKEKATAKAPYLFGDGYSDGVPVYDEWNCPNCDTNYEVDFEHYDYCPMCGQHIDWSEGKE